MGLYDREYTRVDFNSRYHHAPQMRMFFPRVTPMVKWLLIINITVFVVIYLVPVVRYFFYEWFSVYPVSLATSLQLWRLVTYQFLHNSRGFGHIFWNMLILYFLGSIIEPAWGSKKFAIFYLACGACGGILYSLLALLGWLSVGQLIGASGAILGVLAAAAILFPNMRIYVMGIFPIRLVILAVILAGISILTLLRPEARHDLYLNAGGNAAHLAGMVAGAAYVLSRPWRERIQLKMRAGAREKKLAAERKLQIELDRILHKVHDSGIHSLTSKEKKILKKATDVERRRNKV